MYLFIKHIYIVHFYSYKVAFGKLEIWMSLNDSSRPEPKTALRKAHTTPNRATRGRSYFQPKGGIELSGHFL